MRECVEDASTPSPSRLGPATLLEVAQQVAASRHEAEPSAEPKEAPKASEAKVKAKASKKRPGSTSRRSVASRLRKKTTF